MEIFKSQRTGEQPQEKCLPLEKGFSLGSNCKLFSWKNVHMHLKKQPCGNFKSFVGPTNYFKGKGLANSLTETQKSSLTV